MTGVVLVGSAWLVVVLAFDAAVRQGVALSVRRRVAEDVGGRAKASGGGVTPRMRGLIEGWINGLGSGRSGRQDLIVLVDELTASFSSGASPVQAMAAASRLPGPLAGDLADGAIRVGRGHGTQEVLDEWAARHASIGATFVADALALADATGGSRTRALAGVRSTLREADGLAGEISALASQARLSASVLTLVPVGFAALVVVVDPRVASFLLGTSAGWACLLGGAVLDAFGYWWMRRLTSRFR